ncbi:MAG: TIR domain-containing protein [Candidatus Latescibacteria bacterium]|nr:TIR domain-containing protein [Candidatus Latescibacterota bacterium]
MSSAEPTPHIFLSYSKEDRDFAALLAGAIQKHGLKVWWDVDIPAGVHYPKFIEDGLKSAVCVVVLWSRHSVASRWVRNEADWGAEQESLVPLLIDDTELPWEFRNFQTLNLSHWKGDEKDPTFHKLLQGLRARLDGDRSAVPASVPDSDVRGKAPGAGVPGIGRSRPARPFPRRLIVPGLLLLALAATWLVADEIRHRGGGQAARSVDDGISFKPLTGDGQTHSSAISPDGKYLAYTRLGADNTSLRLKQIETGSESVLVQSVAPGIKSPIFSPNGMFIYFAMQDAAPASPGVSAYNLYRVSMLGGEPHSVASGIVDRRFDCSPDGKHLVYKKHKPDSTGIWIANADGAEARLVVTEHRDDSIRQCLAWSSDGLEILTTRRDSVGGALDLIAYVISDASMRVLPGDKWQAVLDIRPLPDGSGLLVLGKPVSARGLNINLWQLLHGAGEFVPLTNDVTMYYQVTSDQSGRNLALNYYDAKRTLRVFKMDQPDSYRDISTDLVANGRVVWTGDGRLLVNQSVGSRIGLVYLDIDGGSNRSIPTDVEYVADMDLSADGRRLVFRSYLVNENTLWLTNSDGSSPRRLTSSGRAETDPQFTRDNRWLVYSRQDAPGEPSYLWKMSITDGSTSRLSDTPGRGPHISPDGKQIVAAFKAADSGESYPAILGIDGGALQEAPVPADHSLLCWNPRGTGFTSSSRDGGQLVLWDVPLQGGQPRRLVEFAAGAEKITDAAWSPDGKSLAVCLEVAAYDALLLQRHGSSSD